MIKDNLKRVLGILILLFLGFLSFAICTGFGVLVAFVCIIFPVWQIAVGTILGSVGVFLYLLGKDNGI